MGLKQTVAARYDALVSDGTLSPDQAQAAAARRLDEIIAELAARPQPAKPGIFSRIWPEAQPKPIRGLYLHGQVGRGKSMLMNLFFECAAHGLKRRLHFHEFMAEVHERIARGRATTDGDPIPFVAAEIAAEAPLLCFDEMQVTDIADAMILGRLFKGLFEKGVVVVTTSNSPPDRLYWNGLNRQLFLPFVAMLEENLETFELDASRDFRLEKLSGRTLYFFPLDAAAKAGFEDHWRRLIGDALPRPDVLQVKGRAVPIPMAAAGAARFRFSDLCEAALGPLDYLQLAHTYHTVFIEGIPQLGPEKRNEARRFITLIDTLYDQRVCLIATAAAEPQELYIRGDGAEAFERTVSRLVEMRSEAYLESRPASAPPAR